ncbi:MAG: twin-arginine translocase TatA/TatE family subunit [Phycisphaerales bacterium]|nr:twin-arginine translocase TatA/TatE family subunit [Phycisphaerales bacterium]
MSSLAFINNLSMWELLVILVVALLLFGRRLPEVGKSLGKGIVEFKKGLKGIEEEVEANSSGATKRRGEEPAYRPPLNPGGQDARVSQAPPTSQAPPFSLEARPAQDAPTSQSQSVETGGEKPLES